MSSSGGLAKGDQDRLPLLHRAAILYLAVPLAVWFLSWLEPWAGVPATLLLGAALWRALTGSWAPKRFSPAGVAAAAVALIVVFFSPISGLFFGISNWYIWPDWYMHRATLTELAHESWPTMLNGYFDGEAPLLRYYLGWHMVPAVVARIAGAGALNWAVPLWTGCGVALVAALFVRGFATAWAGVLAAAALFLFSGVDGADMLLAWALEAVAERPLSDILEYQPHLETLHVTPQHFLPGALGALLLVHLRTERRFVAVVGIVLVACFFWSAILTFALAALACAVVAGRLRWAASWQNMAALPLGCVVALYFASGTMDYPRGWAWNAWDDSAYMWARLAVLYATEFLLLALLVWRAAPGLARDPLYVVVLAVLMGAPLYYYGAPLPNEPGLRLPVPALVLLVYWAVRAVAGRLDGPRPHAAGRMVGGARAGNRWLIVATLAAGAVPVLAHYAGLQRSIFDFERGGRFIRTDATGRQVNQRAAFPPFSAVLDAALRDTDSDRPLRALGERVVRSTWDVYAEPRRLVYVKRDCDVETELGSWLFLETEPSEAQRQHGPPQSRRVRARWIERPNATGGTTLWLRLARSDHYYVEDRGGCLAVADLASDSVDYLRTGQLDHAGRLLWTAGAELRR